MGPIAYQATGQIAPKIPRDLTMKVTPFPQDAIRGYQR